jgi:hypothetical protein
LVNCSERRRPAGAAVVSVVCALALAAPIAQAASPLRYVALGDSYSAASGVLPPDLSASLQCLRSIRNYPHVIAGATGAQLKDVTCGAAETSDYFESQYPGVAPQLDALKQLSTLGQGSPCKDRFGSSFEDTIDTTTYPSLVKSLTAVRAKAPDARIAILGYPWITPVRRM